MSNLDPALGPFVKVIPMHRDSTWWALPECVVGSKLGVRSTWAPPGYRSCASKVPPDTLASNACVTASRKAKMLLDHFLPRSWH